jgi:hypothetical protein
LRRDMALVFSPRNSTPADWMMFSSLYMYTGTTVRIKANTKFTSTV